MHIYRLRQTFHICNTALSVASSIFLCIFSPFWLIWKFYCIVFSTTKKRLINVDLQEFLFTCPFKCYPIDESSVKYTDDILSLPFPIIFTLMMRNFVNTVDAHM